MYVAEGHTSLEPLLYASAVIQAHTVAAVFALLLGAAQLLAPKGTSLHRTGGYVWTSLMFLVALSSFGIHGIDQWRGFSAIHLLSIVVLISLPAAIWAARSGNIERHKRIMSLMFWTGLVLTGLFTLLPGRVMNQVVFG